MLCCWHYTFLLLQLVFFVRAKWKSRWQTSCQVNFRSERQKVNFAGRWVATRAAAGGTQANESKIKKQSDGNNGEDDDVVEVQCGRGACKWVCSNNSKRRQRKLNAEKTVCNKIKSKSKGKGVSAYIHTHLSTYIHMYMHIYISYIYISIYLSMYIQHFLALLAAPKDVGDLLLAQQKLEIAFCSCFCRKQTKNARRQLIRIDIAWLLDFLK